MTVLQLKVFGGYNRLRYLAKGADLSESASEGASQAR